MKEKETNGAATRWKEKKKRAVTEEEKNWSATEEEKKQQRLEEEKKRNTRKSDESLKIEKKPNIINLKLFFFKKNQNGDTIYVAIGSPRVAYLRSPRLASVDNGDTASPRLTIRQRRYGERLSQHY